MLLYVALLCCAPGGEAHTTSVKLILLHMLFQEMKLLFPNSQRINRGNYDSKQLMQACRSNEVTDFIVVHETRCVCVCACMSMETLIRFECVKEK